MRKDYLKLHSITSFKSISLPFLLVVKQLERRSTRVIIPALYQLKALSLILLPQADQGDLWWQWAFVLFEAEEGTVHVVTVTGQFFRLVLVEVVLEAHVRTEPTRKATVECLTLIVHKHIQLTLLFTLPLSHSLLSFPFPLLLLTIPSLLLLSLLPRLPLLLLSLSSRLLLLPSLHPLKLFCPFSFFLEDFLFASLLVLADLTL